MPPDCVAGCGDLSGEGIRYGDDHRVLPRAGRDGDGLAGIEGVGEVLVVPTVAVNHLRGSRGYSDRALRRAAPDAGAVHVQINPVHLPAAEGHVLVGVVVWIDVTVWQGDLDRIGEPSHRRAGFVQVGVEFDVAGIARVQLRETPGQHIVVE
ncbi:MAG: hypothetical protein BWY09_00829 [Candidatus Hydrogenedentes bacterium ADurb.Bin179]|nr:MAG: hypothetical protein BWY09_00829 [Candidatus Hydrogenedentes bacterium ADurb.Bin179]